jgi:hypothetical protein
MRLSKDLREFIELLNFTADIDFLVRPTPANAQSVVAALKAFGFASLKITADDLSQGNQVIQLGVKPNRIDIITSIAGVSFEEAWESRVNGMIDGVPVNFLGRETLITNKEATGRPKDLGDASELRKRKPPK